VKLSLVVCSIGFAVITAVSGVIPARAASTAPPSGARLPATLTLSKSGAAFIAAFEGFSATPYTGRNCMLGYGHVIHPGPCTSTDYRTWGRITVQRGQALLQSDVNATFVPALGAGVPATPLTQSQFDALADWIYNEGPAYIIRASSIRTALRARPPRYASVPVGLMRYVNAAGRRLCGLYRRRASEVRLWTAGSYVRLWPACPPGYLAAAA
jgi:GH24 family phage-related lysozyme (muramidase)